jgi:rhodanese-related sulfurtransferase
MIDVADISPVQAWEMLQSDPKAQLVDVRTTAEWNFVGMPDLTRLGRSVVTVEWSQYPNMARNEQFEALVAGKLKALGAEANTPIVFLCRSGARSLAAAKAMTAAGYRKCFNIAGGFEGDLDLQKHRGQQNGWKSAGLGWKQT